MSKNLGTNDDFDIPLSEIQKGIAATGIENFVDRVAGLSPGKIVKLFKIIHKNFYDGPNYSRMLLYYLSKRDPQKTKDFLLKLYKNSPKKS